MNFSKPHIVLCLIVIAAFAAPLYRYFRARALVNRWLLANGFSSSINRSNRSVNMLVWPVKVKVTATKLSGGTFEIDFSVGSPLGGLFLNIVKCGAIKKMD